MRAVDLAVYADQLAGEVAALTARAERIRSRLRQAAIERHARRELSPATIEHLQRLGLFGELDEAAARAEVRDLQAAIAAVEQLQAWVEAELAATAA